MNGRMTVIKCNVTIQKWDLILNPFSRTFHTDYVGELNKVFNKRFLSALLTKVNLGTN